MQNLSRSLDEAQAAFRKGDLPRASQLLKRALLTAPSSSRAHELLAYVEGERGNLDRVFFHLDKATQLPGASPTSWYYLGVWFRRKERHREAIAPFRKALELDPGLFAAHHDLGLSLLDLHEPEAALAAFDRALAIAPESYEALHNRGRALYESGRLEESLQSYDAALRVLPESAPTRIRRGETLNELRRYPEALADFARAASLSPGNADAELNEALVLLLLGRLEEGWRKYEARWPAFGWQRRHTDIPLCPGDLAVAGKRVLVSCEQGLGDTLHFCRYAPLLAERGARVMLEVQPALRSLLSRLPGCEVLALGDEPPRCDCQISLLSLPGAFGTTLATIPARVPYLSADPRRVAAWAPRLERRGGRLRIGIACSGSAGKAELKHRSMPLEAFSPLQEMADLFLVQVDVRAEDEAYLRGPGAFIRSLADELGDFEDTAAVVEHMDLIVTVDTALAHLAGALGRPVFVLLPYVPSWRWLVDRGDSPWYPTARLFRQPARGDWQGVVAQVLPALRELARP